MESQLREHLNEDACYEAMRTRNTRLDGMFVCAVVSTGIFCRPSCPARTPKRENVVFFPRPEDAASAGFRPCKRCQPDEQAADAAVVQLVCRHIESHLEDRLTLDDLSEVAHLSPSHLQRIFKRVMGISPREYVEARRVQHFKASMKDGNSVTEAIYSAGYSSSSRVYEQTDAWLGMTPAAYSKGGKGMRLHYTLVQSLLGYLLVAGTERGLSFVSLGDEPQKLIEELYQEYPAAEIERDETDLGDWVAQILRYIEGEQPHLDLPLDVKATAFQWRVWMELQKIPYGETRTYSQIAEALGNPKAMRAVGSACANNPVSLVIPCHRAIRVDGGLGGYRWGLERKETLLTQERENAEVMSNE
jgi:AraC family transcriptional regulator, regulatory protein of adaptative response / methylated-DNA-[protein]-cysteine methyltransferase